MPPPARGRPKKKGGKRKKKKPIDTETKKEKLLKWYTQIIDHVDAIDAGKLSSEKTTQNILERDEVSELQHRDIVFHRISRAIDDMKAKEQQWIDLYDNQCQATYEEEMRTEKQKAEKLLQVVAKIKYLVICIAKSEAILADLIYFRDIGAKILAQRIARLQLELDHLESSFETLSREMQLDRDEYISQTAKQVEALILLIPRQVFLQLMRSLSPAQHQLLLDEWWMRKELEKNKQFFAKLRDDVVHAEQINVHVCYGLERLQREYYVSLVGLIELDSGQLSATKKLLELEWPMSDTFPNKTAICDSSLTINRRCLRVRGKSATIFRDNKIDIEGMLDDYLHEIYENLGGFPPQAEDRPPIEYEKVWSTKRRQLPYLKYLAEKDNLNSNILVVDPVQCCNKRKVKRKTSNFTGGVCSA